MRMRVRRSTETSLDAVCIGTQISNSFQRFMFQSVDLTRHASVRRDDPSSELPHVRSKNSTEYICQNIQTRQSSSGMVDIALFFSNLIWTKRFSGYGKMSHFGDGTRKLLTRSGRVMCTISIPRKARANARGG